MKKLWILPMILFGLLVGCSAEASLEPVAIDLGVDSCTVCNMGINDIAHATQVVFEDGKSDIYDDIGCMIVGFQEDETKIGAGYVKDHNSGEWIDMNEATYVQESNIPTPMSYGIVAFNSSDDAETFQMESNGDIYSFDALLQLDTRDIKHESGHDHNDESSDSHD